MSLRLLGGDDIAAAVGRSRSLARGRANHNLHRSLDDPVQRFVNVLQPGSYVRPHRHDLPRWEVFLLLEGEAGALSFDDAGAVIEHATLRRGGARAVEFPAGAWHTVLALRPDTVMFEIKPGPYRPIADKDFAAWTPREGTDEARALLDAWTRLFSAAGR
ncbi:MAG: WbuC family cupin fold metalloprotein [Acidobacteriota bacterium]